MIVISFALVKFYAFAILYVLIVMQIKLVVVVVVVVDYTGTTLGATLELILP